MTEPKQGNGWVEGEEDEDFDKSLPDADLEPLRIRKFEVGDLVFAKMKGFPPWPSKINQIESVISGGKEKIRYYIFFYGTHQTSVLRSTSLCHYDAYQKEFIKKWGRQAKYNDALKELERDMMAKIAYLKDIRNTPDSTLNSGFNTACEGLVNTIQGNGGPKDVHGKGHKSKEPQASLGSPEKSNLKRPRGDAETDAESESRKRGYEVMYMERIPFYDTSEALVIISLKFNEDWVEEEIERMEEEVRLQNCYVRIDGIPPEYAHLEREQGNCVEFEEGNQSILRGEDRSDDYSDIMSEDEEFEESLMRRVRRLKKARKARKMAKWEKRRQSLRRLKPYSLKELSDGSDSEESALETCPVCRKCFISPAELKNHQKYDHAFKETAPIVQANDKNEVNGKHEVGSKRDGDISDADSDILFNEPTPGVQKKAPEVNFDDLFNSVSSGNSLIKKPSTTAYVLKEGFPVDSLTME